MHLLRAAALRQLELRALRRRLELLAAARVALVRLGELGRVLRLALGQLLLGALEPRAHAAQRRLLALERAPQRLGHGLGRALLRRLLHLRTRVPSTV